MSAATATPAASSNVTFAGFGTMPRPSGTVTYSASAPVRAPKTSSPGRNCVTSLPTASTVPAKSDANWLLFGLRMPIDGRPMYGLPATAYQSPAFSDAACTRTSTSSSAGTGLSTSRTSTTSSGGPKRSRTAAFIARARR